MTTKRTKFGREDVKQIIENAYTEKGYKIPQYDVSISGNNISISIDSEIPFLEFNDFMKVINEIIKKMKEFKFKESKGYFYYSYYIMDFKKSK